MTEYLVLAQLLWKNVIVGFKRSPVSKWKIVAASHHLAPCRHAWQRTYPVIIEADTALCQASDIGRMNPAWSIGREKITPNRIQHNEDRFHGMVFLL
jgi:hypothetical protein